MRLWDTTRRSGVRKRPPSKCLRKLTSTLLSEATLLLVLLMAAEETSADCSRPFLRSAKTQDRGGSGTQQNSVSVVLNTGRHSTSAFHKGNKTNTLNTF